jgi:TonB-linked SusC/RagA family outer membrane protein
MKQKGVVVNSSDKRYNFRLNQKLRVSDRLNLSLKAAYSPAVRTSPPSGDLGRMLSFVYAVPEIDAIKTSDGRWLQSSFGIENPIAGLTEGDQITKRGKLSGIFSAAFDILPDLTLTGTYSTIINRIRQRSFSNIITQYNQFNHDKIASVSRNNKLGINNLRNTTQSAKLIAKYKTTLYKNNNLSVLGGVTTTSFKKGNDFVSTKGFLTNSLFTIDAGTNNPSLWNISGGAIDWSLASFIGKIEYSYKDKYLFSGNFRYDGSSRFAKGRRWGFFPSFSAGWILSQEGFLKNSKVLTNLKLRASWGEVGNQNAVGFYPYIKTLNVGSYYFDASPHKAIGISTGVNQALSWETKEAFDIGIEGNILGSLLKFKFDVYKQRTHNILLRLPVPTTYGLTAPVQNAGIVDNRGWELQLKHRKSFDRFTYSISFHISNATNKVVSLAGINPIISGHTITQKGYSMNDWYGLKVVANGNVDNKHNEKSFFQSKEEVKNHAFQSSKTSPGDLIYKDVNGDGVINSGDRVRLSPSGPKYPYGVRISLKYSNFYVDVLGQGVVKNKVWSNGWTASNFDRENSTLFTYMLNRWTPNHHDARYPKTRFGTGSANDGVNDRFSSFWLENAGYFRLKHIEFGYNLPPKFLQKIGMQSARVYVSGENLITITKYLGFDPAVPTGTGSRLVENRYPLAKIYSFGINFNF